MILNLYKKLVLQFIFPGSQIPFQCKLLCGKRFVYFQFCIFCFSLLSLCDRTVRIPMAAHCESLNAAVAAAVLLWEAYR